MIILNSEKKTLPKPKLSRLEHNDVLTNEKGSIKKQDNTFLMQNFQELCSSLDY